MIHFYPRLYPFFVWHFSVPWGKPENGPKRKIDYKDRKEAVAVCFALYFFPFRTLREQLFVTRLLFFGSPGKTRKRTKKDNFITKTGKKLLSFVSLCIVYLFEF